MVVTDVPAAVEQTENADYTAAVQSAESKTLRSQESIIRQARRITGRSVINQSGYLVSAFSMDMTRAQMKQVAALDGVVSVSEVTSYQARDDHRQGHDQATWSCGRPKMAAIPVRALWWPLSTVV